MTEIFHGNSTKQEPMTQDAITAAVDVLRNGRLHRHNEAKGEVAHVALLEQEFAKKIEAKYCLTVASGGYALATALRAIGVKPGDKVLINAFTLATVLGAIAPVGAVPVFVGVTEGLTIDLDDLVKKDPKADVIAAFTHARPHSRYGCSQS